MIPIELCTPPRFSRGPFLLVFVLFLCPLGLAQGEYHHVSDCYVCHDLYSFGGANLSLIGEVIQTPSSGPKPVTFTARTGPNSYADGDGVYDGVCEVCHTRNGHHNNDGVADSRISCPACHNVHGSPSPGMLRHGELISTMGTLDKVPSLNFQYTPEGTYPLLGDSTGGKIGAIGGIGRLYKNGVCNMCHSDRSAYTRPPVTGASPDTPVNLTPAVNETNVDLAPLLTASAYNDPDPGNTHRASQWQISTTSGDYGTPIYDSGSSDDLTSHRVAVWLNTGTTYYWRVRYQNIAGAWSGYSRETSFTTLDGGAPSTLTLTPSGLVDNSGGFSVTSGATWADALDEDDGDASYVYLCCTDPYQSFTVDLDDPVGLQGAVITSVTVHVAARATTAPWTWRTLTTCRSVSGVIYRVTIN